MLSGSGPSTSRHRLWSSRETLAGGLMGPSASSTRACRRTLCLTRGGSRDGRGHSHLGGRRMPPLGLWCPLGTAETNMPARNIHHAVVVRALTADGWTITHDPYPLSFGGKDLFVDLGAEEAALAA